MPTKKEPQNLFVSYLSADEDVLIATAKVTKVVIDHIEPHAFQERLSREALDIFSKTVVATLNQKLAAAADAPERIEIAPGFRLHRLLGSISTKRFREDVLDQLLHDGMELYQEKLAANDRFGAATVKWAMRAHILHAALAGAIGFAFGLFKRAKGAQSE